MTDGNFESILSLEADKYDEEITFSGNGKDFKCKISTAIQTSFLAKYQNALLKREAALKAKKEIEIVVPLSVIQSREHLFPGWKETDGKATFPLTKPEEILTATTIETFVTDPAFTWAEAVVFGRVNGSIALKIHKHIMNWLQKEGFVEAKND